jgi:hypothetical protein
MIGHTASVRAALVVLSAICLSSTSVADQARAPRTHVVATADGNVIARIEMREPGTDRSDSSAIASWYLRKGDTFQRTHSLRLENTVAPIDAFMLANGTVVTLDDWPYTGYGPGPTIAAYSPSAGVLLKRRLEDLYRPEQRQRFRKTSPSVRWRCFSVPPYRVDRDRELWVHDHIGGIWVISQDRKLRYKATGGGCYER